jgi:hypothetical protein
MVLFCFVGDLGSGKTLSLTFLTWKNWFYRKKKIYSNYHLFKIPYVWVDSVSTMETMSHGWFSADEFWLWVDALDSKEKKNRVVTNILLKSRKRDLTYAYTSQTINQLNLRVRKVQDFTCMPILNADESVCKCVVFKGCSNMTYMKTFYFKTGLFKTMYDHTEEVAPLKDLGEALVVFQESKESDPVFFEKWEDADRFAENYWKKNRLWKEI